MTEFDMHNFDAELAEMSDEGLLAHYAEFEHDVEERVAVLAEMARRSDVWKHVLN